MTSCLSKLKVTPIFCFPFKIPDYVTATTVKLGDKEIFDKEQVGVEETFPVTKCQFTS